MLDFVNNLNQKQGNPRRTAMSLAASILIHFCVFMLFSLFPELLAGGYHRQFLGVRWGAAPVSDNDMELWRMVTILEPPERMKMPSTETLRRSLGLGDREEGEGAPPLELRFGPPEALVTDNLPLPQIPPIIEEPEIVIPDNRMAGVGDGTRPDTGGVGELPEAKPAEPGTGRELLAAKPESSAKVDVAFESVPSKIPETLQPPAPPLYVQPPAAKPTVADGANGSSGIGLFDTDGFPMGEYRDIIHVRVRSNWFIPSHLRDILGRTTVVFYIDREGRVSGLQRESSSGSDSLDIAALSAVMDAAPFPPLPKGFPRERVGVRMSLIVDTY